MTTTGWITFLLQEPKALEMLDVVWFKNHLYVAGGEGPPVSRWVFLWEIPNLLGGTPHCPLKMEKLPDFFCWGWQFFTSPSLDMQYWKDEKNTNSNELR